MLAYVLRLRYDGHRLLRSFLQGGSGQEFFKEGLGSSIGKSMGICIITSKKKRFYALYRVPTGYGKPGK